MVEVVGDFELIKEHAQYCRLVLYRMEDQDGGTRLRVRAGRLGYDGIVDQNKVKEVTAWLRAQRAICVMDVVDDSIFFA